MASVFDQLTAAMLAALNVSGAPCVFERVRTTEVGESDLPSGILYPVRCTPDRATSTRVRAPAKRMRGEWLLELRAKGTASLRPDEAVDVLYVWAIAKLDGKVYPATPAAGYLNFDTEEGESALQYEQGENPICLRSVPFEVTFQNLVGNAEART